MYSIKMKTIITGFYLSTAKNCEMRNKYNACVKKLKHFKI